MCMIKVLDNKYLLFIGSLSILAVCIVHIIYGFSIKENYFNPYNLFDSSPLFDFSISKDCKDKSAVVFHKWGGILKGTWTISSGSTYEAFDQTDIKAINGNYFCYKRISYRDLLYNGQIIKKGTKCPSEYPKNCGRIDTLEQELCIKEDEKCPLYDAGIGNQTDLDNYKYDEKAKVYYNNDNYNISNKKIIGRLILNDGQPCYNSTEKLWRSFSKKEGFQNHLKCEFEVFGKYEEERYEERGKITYERLYIDNLNPECRREVMNNIIGDELVHLYKREFFGIDKKCDEKYYMGSDTYDSLHNSERMEYYLLCVVGIFGAIFSFLYSIVVLIIHEKSDISPKKQKKKCIFFSAFMTILGICTICHTVAYIRVTKNDLTGYNCSDPIINEIMRKGFEDITTNIYYI